MSLELSSFARAEDASALNGTATLASTKCSRHSMDQIGAQLSGLSGFLKGSLQAKLAEPSKVAKKSGERAAGTALGISVKDNGA